MPRPDEDAFKIEADTKIDDVQEFMREQVQDPYEYNGTLVWNFSSYDINERALENAIDNKLEGDRFVIPFQVPGTWGVMYYLLPEELRQHEVLVYNVRTDQYRAYRNFYTELSPEFADEFRYQLAQLARTVDDE